jgi:hypothetical protein
MLAVTTLFLVPWLVLSWWLERERWWPRPLPRLFTAGAAFAAGALPGVWGWMGGLARGEAPLFPPGYVVAWGPDLLGYVIPQGSWALGPVFQSLGARLHGAGGREMYVGLVFLALAVLGGGRSGRRGVPLAAAALFAWLVSLGPALWVAGQRLDLPYSPYRALIEVVPAYAASRTPERFFLAALPALAVLAGQGADRLLHRKRPRLVFGALAGLLLLELVPPPLRTEPIVVDPAYPRIAEDPAPGAVMELSTDPDDLNDFVFHQTVHHRPIVGGPIARASGETRRFETSLDLHRRLSYPKLVPGALEDLGRAGVAFLVVHRGGMGSQSWDFLRNTYGEHATLIAGADSLAVFRITSREP